MSSFLYEHVQRTLLHKKVDYLSNYPDRLRAPCVKEGEEQILVVGEEVVRVKDETVEVKEEVMQAEGQD